METLDDDHRTLMQRVLANDAAAFSALIATLRPRIRALLRGQYRSFVHVHDDVAAKAEAIAVAWWRGEGQGRLHADESAAALATRLVKQAVRDDQRHRLLGALPEDASPPEVAAEGPLCVETEQLLRLCDSLPAVHREAMETNARYLADGPPPPHERLRIEPDAFRKRLSRARSALFVLLDEMNEEIDRV